MLGVSVEADAGARMEILKTGAQAVVKKVRNGHGIASLFSALI